MGGAILGTRCLHCGDELEAGSFCEAARAQLQPPADLTAEQVLAAEVPALDATSAVLIDPWGRRHVLAKRVVVGRVVGQCQLALLHPSVSILHAELIQVGAGFHLVDRGSLNGSFVEGRGVRGEALCDGNVVRFGAVSFCYRDRPPLSELAARRIDVSGPGRTARLGDVHRFFHLQREDQRMALVERTGGGVLELPCGATP